jgi:hypothetical protein
MTFGMPEGQSERRPIPIALSFRQSGMMFTLLHRISCK